MSLVLEVAAALVAVALAVAWLRREARRPAARLRRDWVDSAGDAATRHRLRRRRRGRP